MLAGRVTRLWRGIVFFKSKSMHTPWDVPRICVYPYKQTHTSNSLRGVLILHRGPQTLQQQGCESTVHQGELFLSIQLAQWSNFPLSFGRNALAFPRFPLSSAWTSRAALHSLHGFIHFPSKQANNFRRSFARIRRILFSLFYKPREKEFWEFCPRPGNLSTYRQSLVGGEDWTKRAIYHLPFCFFNVFESPSSSSPAGAVVRIICSFHEVCWTTPRSI